MPGEERGFRSDDPLSCSSRSPPSPRTLARARPAQPGLPTLTVHESPHPPATDCRPISLGAGAALLTPLSCLTTGPHCTTPPCPHRPDRAADSVSALIRSSWPPCGGELDDAKPEQSSGPSCFKGSSAKAGLLFERSKKWTGWGVRFRLSEQADKLRQLIKGSWAYPSKVTWPTFPTQHPPGMFWGTKLR